MNEVSSGQVTSTQIFSIGSDSTDSDFIQDYIDSFFPPADSEEVIIEEDPNEDEDDDDGIPDSVPDEIGDVIEELEFSDMEEEEDASGAVVSIISGEVEADEAEKILDMLLNREYDEDDEFEDRSANYQVLEKPMTTGIHLDVIQLIPWTGFEMGELGDEPGDWTDVFDEWFDYITDLLDDIADVLVSGFAYVAEFLTNLDEILKDWGMRVIGAISNFFSALRDAVSEVGELMSVLADWIVSHVSSLFSSVWERVTSGLESWAEGIQEAMEDFFEELAEWDEMDGSESVEDTMEAGSALMLSFIGLQDKASPLMDVVERVMSFIEPFQQYISPMGAMGTIADSLGGPMPEEVGNLFETVENIAT